MVFQDMLVLADSEGVVDMTQEAIARHTQLPLDMIREGISSLMRPDENSRSPEANGARIVLLDSHRDWGWLIVNYRKYRAIRSELERREYMRLYMENYRRKQNSDNEIEKEGSDHCKQKSLPKFTVNISPSPSSSVPSSKERGVGEGVSSSDRVPQSLQVLSNHPGLEDVISYFRANPNYTEAEVRSAFLYFEAGNLDGQWMWGKRPVGDWRAAMETRIQERKGKPTNNKPPKKNQFL